MNAERKEVSTNDMKELVVAMAEGNPGAMRVILDLLQGAGGGSFMEVLILDDMNIRGTQVWIAFKDFAKEDMATFVAAIRKRDAEMIRVVNEEGVAGNHDWKALHGGASFGNRPRFAASRSALTPSGGPKND